MTLNRGDKPRCLEKRRCSTPFAAHQHLHRRSMPVDDRELQASVPPGALLGEFSPLGRCTSYNPDRESWASDSSDSVISSGSDFDSNLYKVILLGEHGVGKTSLARIFGGVEDCPDAEEAGERGGAGEGVGPAGSEGESGTVHSRSAPPLATPPSQPCPDSESQAGASLQSRPLEVSGPELQA